MNTKLRRLTASLLVTTLTSAALPIPAHAEMLTDRERIAVVLDREEIAAQLATYGITQADAKARVAALTDEEATELAGRIDTLPAGGFIHILAVALVGAAYAVVAIGTLAVLAVVGTVKLVQAVAGALNERQAAREQRALTAASAEPSEIVE